LMAILIIEDNPIDRDCLVAALSEEGARLRLFLAGSQEELDNRLKQGGFDLAILSNQLGWATGLAVLHRVKSYYPHCPTILIAKEGSIEEAVEAMQNGLDEYLLPTPDYLPRLVQAAGRLQAQAQQRRDAWGVETRYRDLFNRLPIGLYRTTPAGQLLDVNPALVDLLCYPDRKTLLAANIDSLYVDAADHHHLRTMLAEQGAAEGVEIRIRRWDDEIIWVESFARAITTQAGDPLYYEGTLRDVTQRKQRAEALRHSQQRYVNLLDAIEGIIWEATAPDLTYTLVSKQAEQILGYPVERWRDEPGFWSHHIYEADRGWVESFVAQAIAEGRDHELEYRMVAADGRVLWLRDMVTVVLEEGKVVKLRGIMMDVTERRQTEDGLYRRDAILEALAYTSQQLLSTLPLAEVLPDVLAHLGQAVTASRAYIFENHSQADGTLLTSQRFEWTAVGQVSQADNPALQNFAYEAAGFGRWLNLMTKGEPIYGLVEALPPAEQAFLAAQDILSLAIVPIFSGSQWWGLLGFDDCVQPRHWSPVEIEALQSTAGVLGAVIENRRLYESEHAARERSEVLREVAHIVSASLERADVLRRSFSQLRRVLTFDTASVYVQGEGLGPELVAGTGYADEELTTRASVELLRHSPILAKMSQDMRPVLTGDVNHLPGWIWVPGATHVRSFLAVPLIVRDKWIGSLMMDSVQPDFFSQADVQLCQDVAQTIAVAIDNARLFEAERRQLRLAQTLQAVGALLTAGLSLDEVFAQIFDLLSQVVHYDTVSVQLPDGEGSLYLVAGLGYEDIDEARRRTRAIGHSILSRDWVGQRVFVVPGTQQDDSWLIAPGVEYIQAWVGAALFVKGKFIGILNVNSRRPNAYDDSTGQTVGAFANQAAVAIENTRLFEESQRQTRELAGLYNTAIAVTGVLEPQALLERLYEQVQALLAPDTIMVIFYHADSEELEIGLTMELGKPLDYLPVGWRTTLTNGGLTAWLIRNQQPLLVRDMERDPLPALPRHGKRAARSWLGVPLLAGGRVTGVVSVQSFVPNAFNESDQRLLEAMSSQVAIALENARLFQAEAQRRREAETLNELAAYLGSTLNLQEVLARAVEAVRRHLPDVQNCSISLLEGNGRYLRTRVNWFDMPGHNGSMFDNLIAVDSTISSKEALITRRPVIINDYAALELEQERSRLLQAEGLRALLYVPIIVHGEPVGLLHVNVWDRPRYFLPEEVALCQGVVNQTAIAIENAQLFEAERRQLHLSQTLQQVGALLTTSLTLEEVFEQIFTLLAQVITYDRVSVHLLDEHSRLYLASGRGYTNIEIARRFVGNVTQQSLNRYSPQRQVAIIPNTHNNPAWIPGDAEDEVIRSYMGSALLVKGRMIGILNLDSATPNNYHPGMAETVAAFANQAAVAIENARLYEETRWRANELTVLHQVAQATVTVVNVDDLLCQTTEAVASTLYPDLFGFVLYDEVRGCLVPHPSYHGISAEQLQTIIPLGQSVSGYVARTGQSRIVQDVQEETLYLELVPSSRSEIAVPLKVGEQVIGVINAESPRPAAFTESDLRFLTTLAGQVSTIIERAQLYEQLRQQASRLADQVATRTAELRAERDRTQAVLDSAGEGIFFTDADGIVLYLNPAMSEQTGYTAAEASGRLPTIWQASSKKDDANQMREALQTGRPWSGELLARRQDGTLYDANLTIAPIYNPAGDLTGFVGIQSDISRLKEVDRLKSKFVSNVSHELRTPLTNIKTYLTLLERGRPERQPYYLEVLHHETERLTRLIQDLLDVSNLETGVMPVALQAVHLWDIIQHVSHAFTARAEAKQVSFEIQVAPEMVPALADGRQLEQVLINLIGNALAYTPEGGQITVQSGQMERQGRPMVYLQVTDSGIGIAPQDLPRVFERFFRGQAALDGSVPGTGLGLAISKEIIDRHNGYIDVTSQLGKGTTFTVWLPVAGAS
jgi:PAS domain S-box-containing protein